MDAYCFRISKAAELPLRMYYVRCHRQQQPLLKDFLGEEQMPPPPPRGRSFPLSSLTYCSAPLAWIVRESKSILGECLCSSLSETLQSLIQLNCKVMA